MAIDPILGLLGLARRASKLAGGDALVHELCEEGKARAVFLAQDAGENTAKKAAFYATNGNVPLIPLPFSKEKMGSAIGRGSCAICAVSDMGMTNAIVAKLAAQDESFAEQAAMLNKKNERIQKRRGVKKKKTAPSAGSDKQEEQSNTIMEVSANGD